MAKGPHSQRTGVTYLTPVYSRLSGEMSQFLDRYREKLVEGDLKYLKNHMLIQISSVFSYGIPQTLFCGSFVCVIVPVETMTALGRGGVAVSEYRANTTEGNEAAAWPLIGTQSSGGAWLPGGGGDEEELEHTSAYLRRAYPLGCSFYVCTRSDLARVP